MAKKTTAPTAKEQLAAEAALTQSGKARAASLLSQAAISARQGKTVEPSIATPITTTPTEAVDTGITTSAEAAAEKTATASDLETLLATQLSETEAAAAEKEALYTSRREELGTEKAETLAGIEAAFAQRRTEQEAVNRQLLGSSRAFLGRAGSFSSASGQGQIQRQVIANEKSINELVALEQSYILQAKQAYSAKDMELAEKALASADAARLETNNLRQAQLENQIAMQELALEQSQKESFFQGSDIISLMKELEIGQTTELTDPITGAVYSISGVKAVEKEEEEKPNIKQFEAIDDQGNLSIISYDPEIKNADGTLGAIVGVSEAGKVGKSKTAATTVILNQQQAAGLDSALKTLDASKGSDGYYNTAIVIEELQKYGSQNPGKIQNLLDLIQTKLNPADATARKILSGDFSEVGGIEITTPSGVTFTIPE